MKLFSLCLPYKIRRPEQKREAQNCLKWCAVSGIYCCASREEKCCTEHINDEGVRMSLEVLYPYHYNYRMCINCYLYTSLYSLVYLSYVHFTLSGRQTGQCIQYKTIHLPFYLFNIRTLIYYYPRFRCVQEWLLELSWA